MEWQSRESVLWGDLHRQTSLTCGEGTYAEHLEVARNTLGLDFLSVTDNAVLAEDPRRRQFPSKRLLDHPHFLSALDAHSISEEEWERLRRFIASLDSSAPIFFLGYEWCSTRYGDRNVYYLDDGPLALPLSLPALYRAAAGTKRLLVPHHPGYARGRRGVDWNYHDPAQERLVEIFSTRHGCSEGREDDPDWPLFSRSMGRITPETCVLEALERGYKLGFTAGSDSHKLDELPGLTGVFVAARSKKSLWDGLWNRRTIATTGPRMWVWLEADGHGIGSIVTTDRLPCLKAIVSDTDCKEVTLVRNGTPAKTWNNIGELRGHRATAVLEFLEEAGPHLRPDNYYYLRATRNDGHRIWTSPIWVSLLPDVPCARDILYWLCEERLLFWGSRSSRQVTVNLENSYSVDAVASPFSQSIRGEIEDITIVAVNRVGEIVDSVAFDALGPGETCCVRVSVPEGGKVQVHYRDPFDNLRIIERHDFPICD